MPEYYFISHNLFQPQTSKVQPNKAHSMTQMKELDVKYPKLALETNDGPTISEMLLH